MTHYLDNAATTPVCPEAVQAAAQAMTDQWGNPSARHAAGTSAAALLAQCRADVAIGLGCAPGEVFFTSGGTEANNWAIWAGAELGRRRGRHIITTAIEHAAVLEPCRALERLGYEVTYLRPDRQGAIALSDLEGALREDTVLVSMMLVNNELGTCLPVTGAAELVRRSGCAALLHCDAVQGFLKRPFTPTELGVDLLSISGHKIHAPKGIGALYVRRGLKLPPLIFGGGQEGGLRSGTEPTAQIAALAAAVQVGRLTLDADLARLAQLKQYAIDRLTRQIPGLRILVAGEVPHILPITMIGYKSEVVVRFLSDMGIFVSSGSACHKGKSSHVYQALNLPKKERDGALRISFSRLSQSADVDALVTGLSLAQARLFPALS